MVEIQGENGTVLTGKQFTNAGSAGTLEKVGVINNLGHSLWEQIVLTINDTKVMESSNNYAYKAMLKTLLSYDNRMQVQELYTTTCGQFVVFYIYQKSRGLTLEVILRKYFGSHNKLKNDLLVRDFVKLHYHHDAKVIDSNFIRRVAR